MIKFEKPEVVGWEAAIRGMRNPMNSWDKSDTYWTDNWIEGITDIGSSDLKLMRKLANAGTDHRKFMRMIAVYVDITAPLYWWKEFDTYKVSTVANSCSTMHKIEEKEFTFDDFSHEHILNDEYFYVIDNGLKLGDIPHQLLGTTINCLNGARERYLKTNDKKYWWQIIQLLPSSYNQKRTIMLNYEVLANMYPARHGHKLDEWHAFCEWIGTLPYSELICGAVAKELTDGKITPNQAREKMGLPAMDE